jgi:Flp pilus assembly pilin Flp
MKKMLKGLWRQQSGDDVVEYALLVAMIALGVLIAIYSLGTSNGQRINHAAASLSSGSAGGGGQSGGGSSGGGSGQSGGGSSGGGSGQSGGGSSGGGSGQSGGGGGQGGGTGGTVPTNPVPIK